MTGPELRAAIRHGIRRYARALSDTGGEPPQSMVDDLAAIAERHRTDGVAEAAIAVNTGRTVSIDDKPAPRRRTPKGTS